MRSLLSAVLTRDVRARSPPSTVSSTASTSTAVRSPRFPRPDINTKLSHSRPREEQRPISPHPHRRLQGRHHQAQARQGPRVYPGAQERRSRGEEEAEGGLSASPLFLCLTTHHGFERHGHKLSCCLGVDEMHIMGSRSGHATCAWKSRALYRLLARTMDLPSCGPVEVFCSK